MDRPLSWPGLVKRDQSPMPSNHNPIRTNLIQQSSKSDFDIKWLVAIVNASLAPFAFSA
jgi:hypothetical protein